MTLSSTDAGLVSGQKTITTARGSITRGADRPKCLLKMGALTLLASAALCLSLQAQDVLDPMAFANWGVTITGISASPYYLWINVEESGQDLYNDNPPEWTGNQYWLKVYENGIWYYWKEVLPTDDSFSFFVCSNLPPCAILDVVMDNSEPTQGAHGLLGAGNLQISIPCPKMWK